MMDSAVDTAEIGRAIGMLRDARLSLRESSFLNALRTIDEPTAIALRREILGIAGFLDDSVSNQDLGSIFDRTSRGPVNQMLTNIARAYGVSETVASTTGTTGLNAPAVMSLANEGQLIVIGRDS